MAKGLWLIAFIGGEYGCALIKIMKGCRDGIYDTRRSIKKRTVPFFTLWGGKKIKVLSGGRSGKFVD